MTYYKIFLENGAIDWVPGNNSFEAVEAHYAAVESTIGHTLKICECFNPDGAIKLDRDKVSKIVKVVMVI